MFGNNSKKNEKKASSTMPSSSSSSSSSSINTLGAGTVIEGTINAEGDIRIDGTLNGTINCKGKIIIGPQGLIDGTMNCKNSVVEGMIKGVINVDNELNIKETAKVNGEVNTGQLMVQPGAVFNVSCGMGQASSTPKIATLDKAVAS